MFFKFNSALQQTGYLSRVYTAYNEWIKFNSAYLQQHNCNLGDPDSSWRQVPVP